MIVMTYPDFATWSELSDERREYHIAWMCTDSSDRVLNWFENGDEGPVRFSTVDFDMARCRASGRHLGPPLNQ